eukprot:m.11106 g.11106  ORF g.11106 m.11106 type:complete len:576 (-) comp8659_c0_seq1:120-1847(-)
MPPKSKSTKRSKRSNATEAEDEVPAVVSQPPSKKKSVMKKKEDLSSKGTTERKVKRQRKDGQTSSKPRDILIDKVQQLEKNATLDMKNANDIVTMLEMCEHEDGHVVYKSIHALHRVMVTLRAFDQKKGQQGVSKETHVYRGWLYEQYQDYVRVLLAIVSRATDKLNALPSLKILMDILSVTNMKSTIGYDFSHALLHKILTALVNGKRERSELTQAFVENFLKFDDVQHYGCKSITRICVETAALPATKTTRILATNVYTILMDMTLVDPETAESQKLLTRTQDAELDFEHPLTKPSTYKRSFSDCWLAFLKVKLPMDIFRHVLLRITDDIIPSLSEPKLLIDFLRDSYDVGGVTSILALQGVFTLMHSHNLDYPDFYHKLYQLFDASIFHVKYRARFFRLADLFLKSKYLPGYLVAAFIKRLSRLSLHAPPGGCMTAVRFMYNLMKRHPSTKVLIHNAAENLSFSTDPFIETEEDPSKCRAIESSLWETQALLQHYHPDVARLPQVLQTPALRKSEMNMRRSAQTSYKTLLDAELERKPEKTNNEEEASATPLTFVAPKGLFSQSTHFSGWTM